MTTCIITDMNLEKSDKKVHSGLLQCGIIDAHGKHKYVAADMFAYGNSLTAISDCLRAFAAALERESGGCE